MFDFSLGLSPNFTIDKNRAFWDVRSDATGLRISKAADDGSTFSLGNPSIVTSEFFNDHDAVGGASSVFTIDGDFSVTVTYEWNVLEVPTFSAGDTAIALWLTPPGDLAFRIQVKNFALGDGNQYANMNFTGSSTRTLPSGVPLQGQLIFERVGSVLSGFATDRDGNLSLITSFSGALVSGPMQIRLFGLQNQNTSSTSQIDPRGPMDVSLNHLVVEADSVEGLLPVR